MRVEYVKVPISKSWQPWNSIFLDKKRVLEIITELNNDKMLNCNVEYDVNNQTLNNIVIENKNYNGETIFYIKMPECIKEWNYVFAYVENQQYIGGSVYLNLKIDTITSSYINDYDLSGSWYLEQGHIYEREKNIFCDGCENLNLTNKNIVKSNNIIDYKMEYYISNVVKEKEYTKDMSVYLSDGMGKLTDAKLTIYNNIFSINDNVINLSRSNWKKLTSTDIFLNNEVNVLLQKYIHKGGLGSRWETTKPLDIDWVRDKKIETLLFQNVNGILNLKNEIDELKKLNKINRVADIIDLSTSTDTSNIIGVPRIFDIKSENEIVESFKIDIKEIFNKYNFKNHLLKHLKISIFVNKIAMFEFEPYLSDGKYIYGQRIILDNKWIYRFYYLENEKKPFFETRVQNNIELATTEYDEFLKQNRVSYYDGYYTQQNNEYANIGINTATSALFGFMSGNIIGALTTAGLSLTSSLIQSSLSQYQNNTQREINKQQLLDRPLVVKNIIDKEFVSNLSDNTLNGLLFKMVLKLPVSTIDEYFVIYNNSNISIVPEYITYHIAMPENDDINLITQKQKTKGNVINTYKKINNPFGLYNRINDYSYFKGVPQYVNKAYNINVLKDIYLQTANGVVILKNENVRWE